MQNKAELDPVSFFWFAIFMVLAFVIASGLLDLVQQNYRRGAMTLLMSFLLLIVFALLA